MRRTVFEKLGGYNEEMRYGWGYEDNDLRIRAEHLGIRVVWSTPAFISYLEHGNDERTRHSTARHTSPSEKMHAEISQLGGLCKNDFGELPCSFASPLRCSILRYSSNMVVTRASPAAKIPAAFLGIHFCTDP